MINGINEEVHVEGGTPNSFHQECTVIFGTKKPISNRTEYSNRIIVSNNRTNRISNEVGDINRSGGGENIARDPDGRVFVYVDKIITTATEQGTENGTEEHPWEIKSI